MKYKLFIGGIVAYLLLLIYGGIIIYIIYRVIRCSGDPSCSGVALHNGIIFVLTTVGGLVSALVISKMTISSPGTDPAAFSQYGDNTPVLVKIIVWFYLFFWTIIGLAALVVGVLIYPDISKTLSEFGTTWLGTAVAAGYAYFNIDPKG